MSEQLTPREQIKAAMAAINVAEEEHHALCKRLLEEHQDLPGDAKFLAQIGAEEAPSGRTTIEVTSVVAEDLKLPLPTVTRAKIGALVQVRPVQDEKTYLGFYVGDLPTGLTMRLNDATGVLSVGYGRGNPAILVPSLGRLVFGFESWWGAIKDESDLEQISDEDIQNIPYVSLLRELLGKQLEEAQPAPPAE